MATTAAMPMMMPRLVRMDRPLWTSRAARATRRVDGRRISRVYSRRGVGYISILTSRIGRGYAGGGFLGAVAAVDPAGAQAVLKELERRPESSPRRRDRETQRAGDFRAASEVSVVRLLPR